MGQAYAGLIADLDDAGTGSLCHAQGHNCELGHLEQADIICDSAHQHSNLVLLHSKS